MQDCFMKSPLLLLLSLVIPNCRVPEKENHPIAVVRNTAVPAAAAHPVTTHSITDRPLSVDGIVELY